MFDTAWIIFFQLAIESLPISSSSHVLLLERFARGLETLPSEFDHFLHGPTAIVIALFFYREWRDRVYWFFPKAFMKNETQKRHASRLNALAWKLFTFAFVANIFTGILYFGVKLLAIESRYTVVGLFVTGFLLLSLRFIEEQEHEPLNLTKAITLGIVQGLALFPGVSRFASTYVAGRFLKLSPRRAFQASFLVQFPTCIAAFSKGTLDLVKTPGWQNIFTAPVFAAFVVGMITAFYLLRFSYCCSINEKFWRFGLYMPIPILLTVLSNMIN